MNCNMRISARGRYALAAMIDLAKNYADGNFITVTSIADRLGISKIYLEQVFSMLKKGGVVISVKGSQGGYQLASTPHQITAYDVLYPVETSIFDITDDTVKNEAPEIEVAMRNLVFDDLDKAVEAPLKRVTLYNLINEAEKQRTDMGYMYFI